MSLSFHRCKAGTPPVCQALPHKTRARCVAARSLTSVSETNCAQQLQQARDTWGLQYTQQGSNPRPIVLIVDGTNLGCIAAGNTKVHRSNPFRSSTQVRFAQWLQFLSAVANSPRASTYGSSSSSSGVNVGEHSVAIRHTGPLAAVVVAFDNKGSAMTNVRAQQMPSYLKNRYSGSSDVALAGWSELSSVVSEFDKQQQQQQPHHHQQQHAISSTGSCTWQQPGLQLHHTTAPGAEEYQPPATAFPSCRFFAVHAAYGFEADDVIATAAQWVGFRLCGYHSCSACMP